jgi:hypothetical protein
VLFLCGVHLVLRSGILTQKKEWKWTQIDSVNTTGMWKGCCLVVWPPNGCWDTKHPNWRMRKLEKFFSGDQVVMRAEVCTTPALLLDDNLRVLAPSVDV